MTRPAHRLYLKVSTENSGQHFLEHSDSDFYLVPRDFSPNFSELWSYCWMRLSIPQYLRPTEHSPGRKARLWQSLLYTSTLSENKDMRMDQGQACLRRRVQASQSPSLPPETLNRKEVWPILSPVEVHTDHYRNTLIIESSLVTVNSDKADIMGPALEVILIEFDL